MDEDLTLKVVNDNENRQALLYGMGEQQLDVAVSKLLSRYKVEIETMKPRVPYRETVRKKSSVRGRHRSNLVAMDNMVMLLLNLNHQVI